MAVIVRPFKNRDFEPLCQAFDAEWGWELEMGNELKEALAVYYVANAIGSADDVWVAESEGKAVGVACLAFEEPVKTAHALFPSKSASLENVAPGARQMSVLYAAAAHSVLKADPKGAETLSFYEAIAAANRELCEQMQNRNQQWDAELRLLLVERNARGLGVGHELLDAVKACALAHNAARCILYTDTHCAWDYYEKTGWSIAARHAWTRAQSNEPIEAFAFARRFS